MTTTLALNRYVLAWMVFAALVSGGREAHAQGRDALLNGVIIGAGVGASIGIVFTHAVRDSDLVASQYARGALIFGAIGAAVGLGVDALLDRKSRGRAPVPPRIMIAPTLWRNMAGVAVIRRW